MELNYSKNTHFSKFIHRYLSGYYEWRVNVDHQQKIRWDFADFLNNNSDDLVIEIGCGPGNFLEIIAPRCRHATGLDESIRMLRRAINRLKKAKVNNVELIHSSIESYIPRQQYNLAVGVGVIYLFEMPLDILKKMKDTVISGGYVSTMSPSAEFTEFAVENLISKRDFNWKEKLVLRNWLLSVKFNNQFSDEKIIKLYENADIKNIETGHTLEGMVVFARGQKF